MASLVGEAGGSAKRRAILQALVLPALILTFALLTGPFMWLAFKRTQYPGFLAVFVLVLLAIGAWLSRKDLVEAYELTLESRDWAKGAAGEQEAANDLALLPDSYLVLNDVHPGFKGVAARWNWDHVIIGPTGLFVVDAKNYSASRISEGARDPRAARNIKQVRSYAIAFKNELTRLNPALSSVYIVAMLAYVNPGSWIEKLQEQGVQVLPKRLVRRNVLNRSEIQLSANEAIKIANLLFELYNTSTKAEYRDEFRAWAHRVRGGGWDLARHTSDSAAPPPSHICPTCGASMRERFGQYGAFLGCSKYFETGCTGKRSLDGVPR